MSDIVFVLGAGASRHAGLPLMDDFLDTAHRLWRLEQVPNPDAFARTFVAIGDLQRVHSKSELDLQNLESIFTAFEMARLLERRDIFRNRQLETLTSDLRSVIVQTIEHTILLRATDQVHPPSDYPEFRALAAWLEKESRPRYSVSILTFNYDLAIDYTWHFAGAPIDYALEHDGRTRGTRVFKLHGSLNWGRCKRCNRVVPWNLNDFLSTNRWDLSGPKPPRTVVLPVGSQISTLQHCDEPVEAEPVLVPPSWNKAGYHEQLSRVWAQAASELSEAEHVFLIGFSLPPTDEFFRYLFALGAVGPNPLRRFWVFNPDNSGVVRGRFEKFLGPGTRQRFEYHPMTFRDAVPYILTAFRNQTP